MIFEAFIMLFGMFFLFFGMGVGLITAITFFGMIGGLFGLLAFNTKIIKLPNPKISIFLGYIALTFIFIVLPFLVLMLSTLSRSSYSYSSFNPIVFMMMFLTIPFIHCAITLGIFILLENNKSFNSNYFAFIAAYFIATLIMAPFTMFVGFLGMFSGLSSIGSMSSSLIPNIF